MNRPSFLKKVIGLSLLPIMGTVAKSAQAHSLDENEDNGSVRKLKEELKVAWARSEQLTMVNIDQMPPELFTFKYTPEAMSFGEQWRHCIIYTCGQLSGRAGLTNPYKDVKLPVQMKKDHVIKEMQNLYDFVQKSIDDISADKLLSTCDFGGDTIPVWRLFYAMENHIIHHRGQCVVYLRLKGVIPKGYYGW